MGFFSWFGGGRQRYYDDLDELQQMRLKHGANARAELERRASDRKLNGRDRRHWRRLLALEDPQDG